MKTLAAIFAMALSQTALADVPALNNVDRGELDSVVEEFSANFVHTTVSPAKSLGRLWGFEVGVVAGITKTPKLESLVKETSPGTTVDKIPHGGALAMVTVPFGITAELTFFPERKISDVTVENLSMGVKWTITDLFPLPVPVLEEWIQAAVRLHYANSDLSYAQTIQNSSTGNVPVNATIGFDSTVWGMNATLGTDVLLFEPYFGVGFLKGKTDVDINASGSATIFTGDVVSASGAQSASSKPSSAHVFGGLQLDMFLFHLGAEVARAFGTTSYTGKFSFYF